MPETQRLFVTEGSVHLYSSLPIALTPADLYDGRNNQHFRSAIADCNIYVIATRERILIQPECQRQPKTDTVTPGIGNGILIHRSVVLFG
jgi:hypothetical protein